MVSARMIEVSVVASGSAMACSSLAITVCDTERLPEVVSTIARSPGASKTNILR